MAKPLSNCHAQPDILDRLFAFLDQIIKARRYQKNPPLASHHFNPLYQHDFNGFTAIVCINGKQLARCDSRVFSFSQLVCSAGYWIYQMSNYPKCPTGHALSRVCISQDCARPPSLCSADQCLCSSHHSVCTKLPISDLREAVLVKKMLASQNSNANIARIITSLNAMKKLCSDMLINIYEFAPGLLMTAGENALAEIIEHHRWDLLDRRVLIGVKTSLDTIAKVEDLTFGFKRMAQKYNILDRRICHLETTLLHTGNEMSDPPSISSNSEESIGCFASTIGRYRQSTPVEGGSQELSVDHQEAIEEVTEMTQSMETFAVTDRVQLITYRPASFEVTPLRLDSIRRQQETIKSLDFRCTDLNGTHLAQVVDGCRWPFLLSVDCSNTNINDGCSQTLKQLTIRELKLGGNYLTDRLLMGLEPLLNTLFVLNLSFTYLTDAGVEVLSKELKSCVSLDISYTKITKKGLICLAELSELKELHVWGGWKTLPRFHQYKFYNRANTIVKQQHHRCEFNAISLSELKGKFQLRRWSINLADIDSEWVISNVDKEVQCLQVAGGTPPKSYLQFMLKCDTLKQVYIECCDLTNRKFRSEKFVSVCLVRCAIDSFILDRCQPQNMRVLDLRYSTSQSMDSVVARISTLGLLKQLYLAQCAVTDQHMSCLCHRLQDLEVLDVSLTRITNRGVSSITACRQLQTLNMSNLRIEDSPIAGLATCLLKLRSLLIMQTNVSDQSIPALLGMPSLQNIWVGYSRITPSGITHLKLPLKVYQ